MDCNVRKSWKSRKVSNKVEKWKLSPWAGLVWKMFPHLGRVFWRYLGAPSSHIWNKSTNMIFYFNTNKYILFLGLLNPRWVTGCVYLSLRDAMIRRAACICNRRTRLLLVASVTLQRCSPWTVFKRGKRQVWISNGRGPLYSIYFFTRDWIAIPH